MMEETVRFTDGKWNIVPENEATHAELVTMDEGRIISSEIIKLEKDTREFKFNEPNDAWSFLSEADFVQGSSFVGEVNYNEDAQEMKISLNGTVYEYCNVPQRVFDGFEGAPSKGAYYNRIIKGQFDC